MAMGLTPADFGRDPNAAFVKVLQGAHEPLTARKVIDAVAERGIARATVSAKWKIFQERVVRFHPRIDRPSSLTYRWRAEPVAPDEALARLVALLDTRDKIKAPLRDELVNAIRTASPEKAGPEKAGSEKAGPEKAGPEKAGPDDDAKVRAARERQFKLDALHAVADLAGEVEELAYDSGDTDLIVERLRARVRAADLDQLGRPGDGASFDPGRHDVQGTRPADGAAVTVVRPGYAWPENGSPLVLRKALVVAD